MKTVLFKEAETIDIKTDSYEVAELLKMPSYLDSTEQTDEVSVTRHFYPVRIARMAHIIPYFAFKDDSKKLRLMKREVIDKYTARGWIYEREIHIDHKAAISLQFSYKFVIEDEIVNEWIDSIQRDRERDRDNLAAFKTRVNSMKLWDRIKFLFGKMKV